MVVVAEGGRAQQEDLRQLRNGSASVVGEGGWRRRTEGESVMSMGCEPETLYDDPFLRNSPNWAQVLPGSPEK
jgi:hypothetical protein